MKIKKIIILTSILFLIGIFLGFFASVFSKQNLIIGVMVIILALMLLKQNLTYKPLNNFLFISSINIIIAISTYLTATHPLFGIILSFITVIFIIITTMTSLKNPTYLPYLLLYVCQLTMPAHSINEFLLRILSLLVGSAFIVILNLIINKKKTPQSMIKNALSNPQNLVENSQKIKKEIYAYYPLISNNRSLIRITESLEQIGIILNKKQITSSQWNKLKNTLKNIKNHEFKNPDNALTVNLKIIQLEINNPKTDNIPKSLQIKASLKNILNKNSVKFNFALRIAILITIFEFIGVYYKIPYYRWLIFTTTAITQPYTDTISIRSKGKIIGSILGILIFIILYSILGNYVILSVIMMLYLFIILSITRFDVLNIITTNLALSVATITPPIGGILLYRFFLIVIATVVSTLATYLILPYSLDKESKKMILNYKQINKNQILNLKSLLQNKPNRYNLTNFKALLVSEKISKNNLISQNNEIESILILQNEISIYCSFISNTLVITNISNENKENALLMFDKQENDCNKNKLNKNICKLIKLYDKSLIEINNLEK